MLHHFEDKRNQRNWQKLAIPSLGVDGLVLPASFRLGQSLEDALVLRELAKAEVSLATAPLQLSPATQLYLQQLQPNAVDSFFYKKEQCPRLLGLGKHVYKGYDLTLWNVFDQARSPTEFAERCAQTLKEQLPAHEHRGDFAADLGHGLLKLAEALGMPSIFTLSASQGWMPSPRKLQPHHDFGQHAVRVFFNLCGAGTLVLAPESLPLAQQRMSLKDDKFSTLYPSFNKLAQMQVPLYSLPVASISAWRVGEEQNWPHNYMSCLPHAFPPHSNGLRLTAYADYTYNRLQKHTCINWQNLMK